MSLKTQFLLDPNVIFLNHGSFGATPQPVFESYKHWQYRLEKQPVKFIGREIHSYLKNARQKLGEYLHIQPDDLVFIPNATFGVNILARSIKLKEGDEILTSDHEYGACENAWIFSCRKTGASLVRQPISLPITSFAQIVEQFWQGVTPRTKVIYISHITSPTALCMPVSEICKRARAAGIITIIDGAHAPGQMNIDLEDLGADFYVGNCHKWMLGAKGAGFLYASKEMQKIVEPLVVSWGWGDNSPYTTGSDFLDNLEWWGTKDPAAYLSIPAAIHFQEEHDWPSVRRECNQILRETLRRISELTGIPPIYPDANGYYYQMATAPLPAIDNLIEFKTQLYAQYQVEVPCLEWNEDPYIRISIQAYNSLEDINILLDALEQMLPNYQL
ncbi:MAG: aminotransferase class V-fold PLP-dependent enzyme [Anaerolineales bacterium]|uniref:Aminotransferase class V-fold PLP-dependent enzyme n=1 Tax=Candidatus Desulfolinea nitratireducens TaxID=2841698 RepID=A0A8J6TE94_9CHLR|nr:aminotransferase class V-fold PLP-dependent enzyme [Candidatus Desulfolinea nitratireducens]MBL6960430.1 aminotransferase class V-fold PLP-dependent enzyme [Anaerolineales bacterium]